MSLYRKKRLTIATVVYWLLLIYVVAALVWWFIALQLQNQQVTALRLGQISRGDPAYIQKAEKIRDEQKRRTARNIGEGSTFLLVIAVGAIFLYRAVMRQIRLQQQQQNFMMAVTHELKTPISVAKLNLETLQKYHLDDARKEKIIRSSLQEIERLHTLTGNILVSAQLESGYYQSDKEDLSLSELVRTATGEFIRRYPNRSWNTAIDPDIFIHGDPLLLQILVNNLLENAIKYSPAESELSVGLRATDHQVLLQIADGGPGIPSRETKRIFQKFYRIGNESTRTAQGTGLGLYLCGKIAAGHRAQIRVSANQPAGSIFTVTFHV
jgi:two-component system, OmpR family, sensor histidine kinase CiaH